MKKNIEQMISEFKTHHYLIQAILADNPQGYHRWDKIARLSRKAWSLSLRISDELSMREPEPTSLTSPPA